MPLSSKGLGTPASRSITGVSATPRVRRPRSWTGISNRKTGSSSWTTSESCPSSVRRLLRYESHQLITERVAIDPERIGIFGTSFGGGHAMAYAAKDKRVKAAISQCPFTSGPHSVWALGFWTALRLIVLAVWDILLGSGVGRRYVPVRLAGHPGQGLLPLH